MSWPSDPGAVAHDSLAPAEPRVREFETTVAAVDGDAVVLEETYFYPEGGGQPADRGTLAGHPVADVQREARSRRAPEDVDDGVWHHLDADHDLVSGDRVAGVVDDDFRTYCARAHTASHVLFGAGRQLCETLGYGGFDIGPETVRVDLATPTDVDDDLLVELERLANRAVWESRPVSWETVSVETARSRDGVAFNDATEAGAFADGGLVRLVTVEGWDVAACGGTHVENTVEVGTVAIVDRSNPGAGLTRVEFAVGPRAHEAGARRHRQTRAAGRALDAAPGDVAATARRLRAERDDLRETVSRLRRDAVERTVASFDAVEGDGVSWRVGVVDADTDATGEAVRGTADGGVVAAVGRDGATFLAVASGGAVPAADVVDAATAEFGGGGGGSAAFAQAGGMSADPDEVATYLRERAAT